MTEMTESWWRALLVRWNQEWMGAQEASDLPEGQGAGDGDAWPAGGLGFPPASEERILALEARLGCRLSPSYRAFLAVSDGWRHAGGFLWLLAGTEQVGWHEDARGLSEYFPGDVGDDPTPEDDLLAGLWTRALQLDVESDALTVLLDPGDVDGTGEWAVYSWAPWRASPPERYASFGVFMEAMYREFHCLEPDRCEREGRVFANATTRALDASVESARLEALAGRLESASATLAEAGSYGRPRAGWLREQIGLLLGETSAVSFRRLTTDPLYAPELLPLVVAEHLRYHRRAGAPGLHLPGAPDPVRETVAEIERQLREGVFRYTAEGPFGRAVEEAREQARWGDMDAAWRTLRAALPEWRPLGPDHLAPVGLLADPLLGTVLTPERGRELLATPRAGQRGDRPAPVADQDPPGLAWLTEKDPHNAPESYRFVLVENVDPAELPGRIGAEDSQDLGRPTTSWERVSSPRGEDTQPWADRPVTAVGRAGPGWSFVFDARPTLSFDERRFVSPGTQASLGTRAVTVWSEPHDGHRPTLFQLSVAENGEEVYGFTVRGDVVTTRGTPGALTPEQFFVPGEPPKGRSGERRTLEALTAEFGVRLPRFALRYGRLHTLRTRSWSRSPGPDDTFAVLRAVWNGPSGDL
ncbi:SMI1/KNR4 family protein [Streptomyces sp. NPDC004610]|uniref:SMI1/KNR4 family protein n=1 Tax=unclassified Streptomyces TaxID=2593676 RepID=UPI0033BDFE2D